MSTFSTRLRELRREHALSQGALGEKLGLAKSTINMYESASREPNFTTLTAIADFFAVDVDFLLGKSDVKNADRSLPHGTRPITTRRFPMLGEIACGEPIFADEDHESYVDAASDIDADFCLTARGNSMIGARIHDGDVVFIREQPTVENGEIAAVIIDGEATLKRWYYYKEEQKLMLVAENPAFPPLLFMGEQLADVRCIGRAVSFMSRL